MHKVNTLSLSLNVSFKIFFYLEGKVICQEPEFICFVSTNQAESTYGS